MQIDTLRFLLIILTSHFIVKRHISCIRNFLTTLCTWFFFYLTENLLRNKNTSNSSMLVIGLSVSILINLIFIVCGSLICRYLFYHYISQHDQTIFNLHIVLLMIEFEIILYLTFVYDLKLKSMNIFVVTKCIIFLGNKILVFKTKKKNTCIIYLFFLNYVLGD